MAKALDLVALLSAAILTLCVATGVAWWYGLSAAVLYKFGLLFFGMFAGVVGVPSYYIVRMRQRNQPRTSSLSGPF